MSTFFTVQGADFARSIRWARGWTNPLNAHIRKHLMTATTEMKIITRAKFFPGAGGFIAPGSTLDRCGYQTNDPIINPAEVEYNGIRLFSATPKSAAEAEKINRALGHD